MTKRRGATRRFSMFRTLFGNVIHQARIKLGISLMLFFRVPADKHPEIAPSEFANWIKLHGTSPTRNGSKVRRQKSKLSKSVSLNDPPPLDINESPVLPAPRALSRRTAFSARRASEANSDRRRGRRPLVSRHSTDVRDRMGYVPSEGIRLQDRPVSLSEWIDLGSASLASSYDSPQGILSRVKDAESHICPDIMKLKEPPLAEEKDDESTTLRRSMSQMTVPGKPEKRLSWLSGILNSDKRRKGRRGRVDDEQQATTNKRRESLDSTSPKRGIAAFITRSLSLKSSSRNKKEAPVKPVAPPAAAGAKPVERYYIHDYRLPIHVERAIYRLSHMKLANPRRPLQQQVVISNFMFWYLSIINPSFAQQQSNTPGEPKPPFTHHLPHHRIRIDKPRHHPSRKANRRRSKPVIMSSDSSSDEEDNVPLSYYKK